MTSQEEIAHLSDVPVQVEVELDRKVMSLGSILDLKQGSVLKLTRSAGENIDILIGGALVGFGEIVVIEDSMGVRITDFNGED
jgi:flagellar motor switch protein FliN